MNEVNQRIFEIFVVPVIKLNHPERDAAPLAKVLRACFVPVGGVHLSGRQGRNSHQVDGKGRVWY